MFYMGKRIMKNTNDKKGTSQWEESFFVKSLIAGADLLAAVINVIVAVVALLNGQNVTAIIFGVLFVIALAAGVVAFSLRSVQKSSGIKSKSDYEQFTGLLSNRVHEILHRIRDSIFYMESVYIQEETTRENFEKLVTRDAMQLLDAIAAEFKAFLNTDVRVCVKCLDYTAENEDDIRKMNMITFARSGHKNIYDMMYEHRTPIKIEDNTDFTEILESGKNNRQRQYFYEKNLLEYDEKLKEEGKRYKNSNKFWSTDYITTIVCPIRLKRNIINNENGALEYDLVGFFCIDSKNPEAFTGEVSDFCLDLVKGIADIMFVYLDRFITYYNELIAAESERGKIG